MKSKVQIQHSTQTWDTNFENVKSVSVDGRNILHNKNIFRKGLFVGILTGLFIASLVVYVQIDEIRAEHIANHTKNQKKHIIFIPKILLKKHSAELPRTLRIIEKEAPLFYSEIISQAGGWYGDGTRAVQQIEK